MALTTLATLSGTGSPAAASVAMPTGLKAGDLAVLIVGTQGTATVDPAFGWSSDFVNTVAASYYGSNGTIVHRTIDAPWIASGQPTAGISVGGSLEHNAWVMLFLRGTGPLSTDAATKILKGRYGSNLDTPAIPATSILLALDTTVGTHSPYQFPNTFAAGSYATRNNGYGQVGIAAYNDAVPAATNGASAEQEMAYFTMPVLVGPPYPVGGDGDSLVANVEDLAAEIAAEINRVREEMADLGGGGTGPLPQDVARYRGDWDSLILDYKVGNFVSHNGQLYLSLADDAVVEPGEDDGAWMLASGLSPQAIYTMIEEAIAAGPQPTHTLAELWDVDLLTNPPTDQQALVFDEETGVWIPGSVAAGGGGGGGTGETEVLYYDGSTYPARPSTSHAMIWHGPVNPGAAMLDGDTWIDTSDGDPTPGGYLVYVSGAYPARADNTPVTFVGPVSPFDLGLMINGDTWINTTTATVTNAVYVSNQDVGSYVVALVQDTSSATYAAVKAVADAAVANSAKPQDVKYVKPALHVTIDELDGAYSSSWLRVDADATAAGRVTWAQAAGVMAFTNNGGDPTSQMHALMRPGTLAVGECLETCMTYMGNQSPQMMGLVVADGATYGAGNQVMAAFYNGSGMLVGVRQNTNYSVAGTDGTVVSPVPGQTLDASASLSLYVRLKRSTTANTWDMQISRNGVLWTTWSRLTNAVVPTHVGFFCSGWGQSGAFAGHFDYIRKVPV